MTLVWKPGWNGLTEPEAVSYVAAVEAADGQPLEFATAKAINDFVRGCKNDGIWSAIKASCILAGARTLAGALVPLVGTAPTNFNFVSSDYNRKTGLVGNGSTKWLDSGYAIPAGNQNNAHAACRASSISGAAQFLLADNIGAGAVTTNISVNASTGQVFSRLNTVTQTTTIEAPADGFYGVNRNTSASYGFRFNGSTRAIVEASTTPAGFNIGLYSRTQLPAAFFTGRLAFYSIGESLDLALLDARVTDLITALGAAIP
jgi:hypothetical protein